MSILRFYDTPGIFSSFGINTFGLSQFFPNVGAIRPGLWQIRPVLDNG